MPRTISDNHRHTELFWNRVDAIVSLILENVRYMQSKRSEELVQLVQDKFDLETRMAQYYIKEAKTEIRKIGKRDKDQAFVRAIRDREFLFQKAKTGLKENNFFIVAPDYEFALKVVKDRDDLYGLYKTEIKIDATTNSKTTIDFTGISTEDLKAIIEAAKKTDNTSEEESNTDVSKV